MKNNLQEYLLSKLQLQDLRNKDEGASHEEDCHENVDSYTASTHYSEDNDCYRRYTEYKKQPSSAATSLSSLQNPFTILALLGALVIAAGACYWAAAVGSGPVGLLNVEGGGIARGNSSREWESLYFSELADQKMSKSKTEMDEKSILQSEDYVRKIKVPAETMTVQMQLAGLQLASESGYVNPTCKIDETKDRQLPPYNAHSCITNNECTGERVCTAFGWCRGKSLCGKNQLKEACKIQEALDFKCEKDEQCRGARICSDSYLCEGLDSC